LKLLETPFQQEFLAAPDVPWPSEDVATVRTVGGGAGKMAYILVQEAGHFVRICHPAKCPRLYKLMNGTDGERPAGTREENCRTLGCG
jgi:hypothetical protein